MGNSPSGSGRCPKGHLLREFTASSNYRCDVCGENGDGRTPFYGCRTCNFDKCLYCETGKTNRSQNSRQVVQYQPQPQQQRPQQQRSITTNSSSTTQKYTQVPSKHRTKDFDIEKCLMSPDTTTKTQVLRILGNLKPSGKTSLYDAIANGTTSAYALALALLRASAGSQVNIRLVNVVLTDGEDTSENSRENFEQLGKLLRLLHGSELDLEDSCQTFLVGIGNENFNALKILATVCGKYCTFQQVSDVKIEDLFEQIEVKVGIAQRIAIIATEEAALIARKRELQVQLQVNRYVVIFTIDHSGSMAGDRWDRVQKGLRTFLDKLGEKDLFSIQLFNHETCWVHV